MDFGPHTVHVFVSLFLVLAVACVALVCDLLRGNNDHLRELAIELKIRKEEAERRAQAAERKSSRAAERPVISRPAQIAASSSTQRIEIPLGRREQEPERVPMPTASPAISKVAAAQGERNSSGRPERRKREMSPAVAAVAQAAAAIANNSREHQPVFSGAESQQEHEHVAVGGALARKNWDSILKSTRSLPGSVIPFESIRDAVPAGFHDASVLQRAVESGRVVSGLILSIGTNALSETGANEVAEFLKSLAGPQDFTCQSGSDEYVLICAGEQGASAQRRLSAIAEKLWEFQLRSMGALSVQFSWGSAEARGERIGEAVATAIEQMQETRQSRRVNIAKAV